MPRKKIGKNAMDVALTYLTTRPRTVREVERRLDENQFSEGEIMQVIARLEELGYLNDEKYAEDYVATRLATKPVSKRKLYDQLLSHAISKELAEAAVAHVPDEQEKDNIRLVAEKFFRQYQKLETGQRRQLIVRRLLSRGYTYEDIKGCIDELFGQSDETYEDYGGEEL